MKRKKNITQITPKKIKQTKLMSTPFSIPSNMITLVQLIHFGSGFILQTVKTPIDFTCNGWKCLELITVIKIH